MRPRHLKLLSLWIVPLLLARAMIPTGFMLSADRGALELTFCPAGVSAGVYGSAAESTAQSSAAHAGHHDAGQHGGGDDHANHHSDGADGTACPFSLVAAVVAGDVAPLLSESAAPVDEVFDFISAPVWRVGPDRTDRIRGPPSYS